MSLGRVGTGQSAERLIGPYTVVRDLGTGGMGEVYLARSSSGLEVAVKALRAELADSAAFRRQFAAEVTAAKAVSGAFTAPVVAADPFGPHPWLATAFVAGPTLEQLVDADGPLAERRLHELAAGLTEALIAIHTAGVVHRDLKPSNVLMASDGPRVIDFGIGKDLAFLPGGVETAAAGSIGFSPPELWTGEHPFGRAGDVFALGAVLVFAAGGRGPFGDGPPQAYPYRVVYEQPDISSLPDAMRPVVAACLSKDPEQRPMPAEVLDALAPPDWRVPADGGHAAPQPACGIGGRPDSAETEPDSDTPRRLTRRRLLAIAGTSLAAGGAVAGTALARTGSRSAARRATSPSVPTLSLPGGPDDLWASSPATPPSGQIQVLGDLVLWGFNSEQYNGVLAFDAASGAQRWTGANAPPILDSASAQLFGVWGSAVYGGTSEVLFGLDVSGRQVANVPIGGAITSFWGVIGSTALMTSSDGLSLVATSLRDGNTLWTSPVQSDSIAGVVADEQRCYMLASEALTCIDLASGRNLWSKPGLVGSFGSPVAADGAVFTSSSSGFMDDIEESGMAAFDPASGAELWGARGLTLICAAGSTIFARLASTTSLLTALTAVDARTGRRLWTWDCPVPLTDLVIEPPYSFSGFSFAVGPWASADIVAVPFDSIDSGASVSSETMTEAPGFAVVDAVSGKPLWAHFGPPDPTDFQSGWVGAVVGDMIYSASSTTLYAFRAGG